MNYLTEKWEAFKHDTIWHVIIKDSINFVDKEHYDCLYDFEEVCTAYLDDGTISKHIVELHNKSLN